MSKSFKDLVNNRQEGSDDGTLHDDEEPSVMMYMPSDGTFAEESSTLFEGEGSSAKRNKPRQTSMSDLAMTASLKQIHYNENRVALDRAINSTIELLHELSAENRLRPIFFPAEESASENALLNSPRAHLALVRRKTDLEAKTLGKAKVGDLDGVDLAGDEDLKEVKMADFKVLKLNLKMGHSGAHLMDNLDKKSVSMLLDQKFSQQIKYLLNLKDRVDDTSSKVFVTGDLNAGKSTFCNALLKRRVLPEDQQPCTSVFCEVIDAAKVNMSIEEVHAVPIGKDYDRSDEFTYERHPLNKLEDLVYECDQYSLLKVYVLDYRKAEESLLGNGVIDVKLIDAPGLNMDSYQTTQVFSRQEEIDLVVFVVNSENHFTLSAKEFIAAAAAEKRYVFIVVNRFDNIKDKNKCMSRILDQVKNLSPYTHKDAKDFVHFVSSSEVLKGFPDDGGDGGDDGPGDNGGPDFDDPNFDHLENSLRKFLLDKRSISKLLPAKSYILNILADLKTLSDINGDIYRKEIERKQNELRTKVAPKYDQMIQDSVQMNDKITKLIEKTCTAVYNATKGEILSTVDNFGSSQIVPYGGLQFVYDYAKETQRRMIDTIVSSVQASEGKARALTEKSVQEIVTIGQSTLGDEFLSDKVFKADLMFTRRRDTIKRQLDDQIEISDFFDPSFNSVLTWIGIPSEIISTTKQQVEILSPTHILTTIPTSVNSLKRQLPTQLTLQTLYSSTKLLTTGALLRKAYTLSGLLKPSVAKKVILPLAIFVGGFTVVYLINDIPNAFPRKQAKKLKKQVLEMDYAHVNADRVSKECRQVLNFPSRQVMNNFQTSIDRRSGEKEKLEKEIRNAEISSGYFRDLLVKIEKESKFVYDIDLEKIHSVD
ncbi:hypothetical protein C7M61_001514 [Candidozyma pseudohaemuli]|uniref:Dynamin-type G domain-containing protein n=1 Tax=Candidozyma pseudohaemuli TaxID=418784 RepID=A0A2P7YUT1_9ASCO|nr:hypothetical protein C7M61_001514 [[Candida] pseudohaemulonii]PSK39709.1 hypothetical protein C7M61_001514 [[Candida] pseudohaemulonii]